ncbi:wax ester/triacylglycerol synthase domain-containing protein [Streptomyces sp. NPDC060048]|uniref:wax ester/triacylglycerol synthase domain-containing protein n=1 Tax=unclassified Streptomyces TaxID=2593676 RepID=UPI0036B6EFF6
MQSFAMPLNDALFVLSEDHFAGVSTTCTVVGWFQGAAPALGELRAAVQRRWAGIPRLSMKVTEHAGLPVWRLGEPFLAERHVSSRPPTTDEGLQRLVSEMSASRMDRDSPPWELLQVIQPGGEFCLVLRFHHALLDGVSASTLLRVLLEETEAVNPLPAGCLSPVSLPKPRVTLSGVWEAVKAQSPIDLWRAGGCLPPSGPGDLAWQHLPFQTFAAARASLPKARVTVNDVFMSAVAGALHSHPHLIRDRSRPLRVMFPVDLRTPSQAEALGDITSMDTVALPQAADRHRRLLLTHHAMRKVKQHGRPAGGLALLKALVRIGGQRAMKCVAAYMMSESYADVLCSNVRVPWTDANLLGRPLLRMCMLPPHLHLDHTFVQLTNFGDTLTVTAMTPQGHAGSAASLVTAVCEEVRALADVSRTADSQPA